MTIRETWSTFSKSSSFDVTDGGTYTCDFESLGFVVIIKWMKREEASIVVEGTIESFFFSIRHYKKRRELNKGRLGEPRSIAKWETVVKFLVQNGVDEQTANNLMVQAKKLSLL